MHTVVSFLVLVYLKSTKLNCWVSGSSTFAVACSGTFTGLGGSTCSCSTGNGSGSNTVLLPLPVHY